MRLLRFTVSLVVAGLVAGCGGDSPSDPDLVPPKDGGGDTSKAETSEPDTGELDTGGGGDGGGDEGIDAADTSEPTDTAPDALSCPGSEFEPNGSIATAIPLTAID